MLEKISTPWIVNTSNSHRNCAYVSIIGGQQLHPWKHTGAVFHHSCNTGVGDVGGSTPHKLFLEFDQWGLIEGELS